jgi:hypothetical protein
MEGKLEFGNTIVKRGLTEAKRLADHSILLLTIKSVGKSTVIKGG